MSEAWVTIGVLAVGTALIRAAGPLLLGGRDLPARMQGVVALLAPALLAALVAVQTFGASEGGASSSTRGPSASGPPRSALAAGAALLPVVALAAVATALARACSSRSLTLRHTGGPILSRAGLARRRTVRIRSPRVNRPSTCT